MDTRDFLACVELHARVVQQFQPHVLVGSSFGGAVAVALLHRKAWSGPTVLLAPAVYHYDVPRFLPPGIPVWIVHGTRDTVVHIEDSRALAKTGTPELVRLIEVDDDHALSTTVARSELIAIVSELVEQYCPAQVT
jgi:alpha/beta superfamily hydrolase